MEVVEVLRKMMLLFSLLVMFLFPVSHVHGEAPAYAKWGKIAIEQTTKKYPNQQVTDYRYDGKVFISNVREQYDFDFTLKQNGQSREIRVYVLVNPQSDELIDVKYDEIEEFQ